jgi:predicted peptidase
MKECPLFAGEHSLVRGPESARFPAVILVPQMIRQEAIEGVTHEWAAFTKLDPKQGTMVMADQPSRSAKLALRALDELVSGKIAVEGAIPRIDTSRIYLTGHSMGGLGTWDLLARRPNFFAGAVVMAGYPDWSKAEQLAHQPLWAFHHEIDCYNVIGGNQGMIERIREAGGSEETTRFTKLTFDTGGKCDQAHFRTPEETWKTEGVLEWLFSQRLEKTPMED